MARTFINSSKLSVGQVISIREKDSDGVYTHPCSYWAKLFFVNAETVRRARSGDTWNWLDHGLSIPDSAVKIAEREEGEEMPEDIKASIEKFQKKLAEG